MSDILTQVYARVTKLREHATRDASLAQQGLGKIQQESVIAKGQLEEYLTTAEASATEDSTLLSSKLSTLETNLQTWYVHVIILKLNNLKCTSFISSLLDLLFHKCVT